MTKLRSIIIGLVLGSHSGMAAPAPSAWMPWQFPGMDASLKRNIRPAVDFLQSVMIKQLSGNDFTPPEASFNRLRHLKGFKQLQLTPSRWLTPFACTIPGHVVFGVQSVDPQTQTLVAVSHRIRTTAQLTEELPAWLTQVFPRMIAEVQGAESSGTYPPAFALHLASSNLRQDRGVSLCYLQILVQGLSSTAHIVPPIGQNDARFLGRLFNFDSKARRRGRTLTLQVEARNSDWPLKLDLGARFSEGILGGRIATQSLQLEIQRQGDQLGVTGLAPLAQWIKDAQSQLRSEDWPQVAATRGAWAYLDRGRTWGLAMDDRMIAKDRNGEWIKGHIVGFYGPGYALKSPRGHAIQDGAILYIRKGLQQIQKGTEFRYDPTQFPTNWPPVKQPSGQF